MHHGRDQLPVGQERIGPPVAVGLELAGKDFAVHIEADLVGGLQYRLSHIGPDIGHGSGGRPHGNPVPSIVAERGVALRRRAVGAPGVVALLRALERIDAVMREDADAMVERHVRAFASRLAGAALLPIAQERHLLGAEPGRIRGFRQHARIQLRHLAIIRRQGVVAGRANFPVDRRRRLGAIESGLRGLGHRRRRIGDGGGLVGLAPDGRMRVLGAHGLDMLADDLAGIGGIAGRMGRRGDGQAFLHIEAGAGGADLRLA